MECGSLWKARLILITLNYGLILLLIGDIAEILFQLFST